MLATRATVSAGVERRSRLSRLRRGLRPGFHLGRPAPISSAPLPGARMRSCCARDRRRLELAADEAWLLVGDGGAAARSSGAGAWRSGSGRHRAPRRSAPGSDPARSAAAAARATVRTCRPSGRRAGRATRPARSRRRGSRARPAARQSSSASPPGDCSESALWPPRASSAAMICSSLLSSAVASSPTVGARSRSCASWLVARVRRSVSSCTLRGGRTIHVRSRKWRLSAPRIVGTAKLENAQPWAVSKRSIALTSASDATWTRSSIGSPKWS